VSRPYAPGETPVWTVYSYDCLGRTLSVAQPASSGTTTYVNQGNSVTVTDPAGKWKTHTTDALGKLVQFNEPDPSLGNVQTIYTYNLRNQLAAENLGSTVPRAISPPDWGRGSAESRSVSSAPEPADCCRPKQVAAVLHRPPSETQRYI
jgi:hypothetical protein